MEHLIENHNFTNEEIQEVRNPKNVTNLNVNFNVAVEKLLSSESLIL